MNKTNHPLYARWNAMRRRCMTPTNAQYRYYGGRGITICPEWDDFDTFVADMGECPEGYELDRIDVDGNYEPSNCRWISHSDNLRNRRPFYGRENKRNRYLRTHSNGYQVQIIILKSEGVHRKWFKTYEQAVAHRDVCEYERDFYKRIGID